jgi:prepilin-type N-terminal cleavage/methylation domain-containing protein
MRESGFSLFELLVVLTLGVILTGMALPEYRATRDSFSRLDAPRQLDFHLRRARSEALASGSRVIVASADSAGGYTVGHDYYPYSANATTDDTFLHEALPSGVTATFSRTIIFDTRGFLIDSAGLPVTATVTFNLRGAAFGTATISSIGVFSFSES